MENNLKELKMRLARDCRWITSDTGWPTYPGDTVHGLSDLKNKPVYDMLHVFSHFLQQQFVIEKQIMQLLN